jgi:hypothetical protein
MPQQFENVRQALIDAVLSTDDAQLPYSGVIDKHRTVIEDDQLAMRGRVSSLSVFFANHVGLEYLTAYEIFQECGFTYP